MKTRTWEIPEGIDWRTACVDSVSKAITEAPIGYEVRISPPDKSRTQRAKFHVLCEGIGSELGNTPAEIKTAIKQYHYGIDEKKIGNDWCRILRSTEEDNREQYSALIEAALRWGAENGVHIEG